MAVILEIVDLPEESRVQLTLTHDSGNRETAPPSHFPFPLSQPESAEIQWYLTEYLENPYGAAKDRAQVIESGLQDLGKLLFEAVFRASAESQDIVRQAASLGLEQCRLAIVSSRSEFLELPWELLNHENLGYLVNRMSGIVRRHTAAPIPALDVELPTGQFNVLLLAPPAGPVLEWLPNRWAPWNPWMYRWG